MVWRGSSKQRGIRRLFFSFIFAGRGLWYVVVNEQNMFIHLVVACFVFSFGFYVGLNSIEWALLVIVIGGVIALEMINTAVERIVDMVSVHYHPLAKIAKDVAASAVFIYSMVAVVVGILIFYQPVMDLFQ